MSIKELVFFLFIAEYAHSAYVADIQATIGTIKKIIKLEIGDRDWNKNNPPSKFFIINDGERIEFFHRVLDQFGSYDVNLGGRGGLTNQAGLQFVSFTRKSLITVNYFGVGSFYMGGEIEFDNNQKLTFFASPSFTLKNDKKKRNFDGVNQNFKRQVSGTDYYGTTCALGSKNSSCDQCGLRWLLPNVKRIVGGQTVAQTSWPSVGVLMGRAVFFGSTYNVRCTLTLIERTTAITAAQCYIKAFGIASYTVVFGMHKMEIVSYLKFSGLKSFITHPNYNNLNGFNDIAVIKLSREIPYDLYTQPACLPLPSFQEPTSDQRAWIVGYGTTSFGGNYTEYLQNAAVTYYASSSNKCMNYVSRFNSLNQICAGNYENGGVDSCNGDSGGPLYTKDVSSNKYVLTGVTSGGFGCGKFGFPGIYTKVQPYLNWIVQNI